jgi:hypothetical protein
MELGRKLKLALDETRLLILGAQVLFGFQFEGVFQELFPHLPGYAKAVHGLSLLLLLVTIGCLIAPSLCHQIAYRGEAREGALQTATLFAAVALAPLTLGLGASAFVVFDAIAGFAVGVIAATGFVAAGGFLFYGLGLALMQAGGGAMPEEEGSTPLKTKIEQMLTEARVMIPGGQALLGFQFIATLTRSFHELPSGWQYLHALGLCAVAIAVMLLMTPAALHRMAYRGDDNAAFLRIGSRLVIASALPLAIGIALDIAIVFYKITDSDAAAWTACIAALIVLIGLWYVYPLQQRGLIGAWASHTPEAEHKTVQH